MASAQVLPNSRQQELRAAGKRRLEEFRKKKAASGPGQAKKTAAFVQTREPTVGSDGKQSVNVRLSDLDGASLSNGLIRDVTKSSAAENFSENKENDYPLKTDKIHLNYVHANSPISTDGLNSLLANPVQNVDSLEINKSSSPQSAVPLDVSHFQDSEEKHGEFGAYNGYRGGNSYHSISSQSLVVKSYASRDFDGSSSRSSLHGIEESKAKDNFRSVEDTSYKSGTFLSEPLSQNYKSIQLANEPRKYNMPVNDSPSYSFYRGSVQPMTYMGDSNHDVGKNLLNNHTVYNSGGSEFNAPVSNMYNRHSDGGQPYWSASYSSDAPTFSNYFPSNSAPIESISRRSRPSFLDSINVFKSSSGAQFPCNGHESIISTSSTSNNENILESDGIKNSSIGRNAQASLSRDGSSDHIDLERFSKRVTSAQNGDALTGSKVNQISFDGTPEFFKSKENEDFSALEQHIEDLTQEKFSLQRALESSRTLAESLAAENSTLTETYNQQRTVVERLKSDMEQLQQEIKVQLTEIESIKMEYANVQLECNAADERAKLLAKEVISLEEKALRLRSTELKLERELQNSQAEVFSYKKNLSNLEKDRQDLQSTISALEEEKKIMQSKLRKCSVTAKTSDVVKSSTIKRDMSTSTEDLDDTADSFDPIHTELSASTSLLLPPGIQQSSFQASLASIPPDQMKMIQNINSLVSELALEKEELMNALASESSINSKLKEFNKELFRKLEVQTQRVELLISQSMASDNAHTRLLEEQPVPDLTAYADEGDEVVDRVLGWIMKLFPGGPSRRRMSKLI